MQPRSGMLIGDKLRLSRPLGEGGMGAVWVAHHLTLDTEVAVKLVSRGPEPRDLELLARFDREVRAVARLKSPHVVQVFDHGVHRGTPYMVMELLEGETLATTLEKSGWLDFDLAAAVMTQIASALTHAHLRGIIHRDIKPENIFLCSAEDGPFAKLLDFGVAKAAHIRQPPTRLTSPGMMIGTPEYLSREQVISSKDVDHMADLWALAVVGYEMLTGDVPFTGATLGLLCIAICAGDYTPPSKLRKGLPPEVDWWFARAVHTSAAARHPSARELATAYGSALKGVEGAERRPSRSGRTERGIGADLGPAPVSSDASPPTRARVRSRARLVVLAAAALCVLASAIGIAATGRHCFPGYHCNAASSQCLPKAADGEPCGAPDECLSGFCPAGDGICCDSACDGLCRACSASKTPSPDGVCAFVGASTDPDDECLLTADCDGTGACQL